MKIPLFSLLAVLLMLGDLPAQTSTASLYSEAQRAYLSGDVATAKAKFEEVLSAEPTHAGAKNYLKAIAVSNKNSKNTVLAGQLNELIVPKVTFKEASLVSVLDYLKAKASEVSQAKVNPSFVLQLPPDYAQSTLVTLDLTNVPFTEVLRYIGGLTSTKFEIQQYAIIVKKS